MGEPAQDGMLRQALIAALHETGLFQTDFYLQRYPDVAQTGLDPMWHFVKYGLDLGRSPGTRFDPGFYQRRYPDVGADGQGALAHYLLTGRSEGRFPTPEAEAQEQGMARVRHLQAELWGGLESRADPALLALLDDPDTPDPVRFEAGCQLAFWCDFAGEESRALALLTRLGGFPPAQAYSELRLIPMALLLARRGSYGAACAVLDSRPTDQRSSSWALARANMERDAAAKLRWINGIYDAHGLTPLCPLAQAQPLSLSNLATETLPSAQLKETPLVSVLMPVFRGEATVAAALRSLQTQSYPALEIIVVDDASPAEDSGFDIITAMAQEDPRIIPIRRDTNGGAYAARNTALARARGAYITTHDADDWSHPQKIERQVAALQQAPDLMGVIAHWTRVAAPFQITSNWRLGANLLQWSHSSFLFRRAVTDQLGGWEEMKVSADMEFIWRVEAAFGAGAVQRIARDVPLAFALDDSGSLTRANTTHVRSTYIGLRHYYREISRYWHRQAPAGLSPDQKAAKLAMVPAAMRPGQDGAASVALLLRGDLCAPAVVARMRALAAEATSVAIAHVPDPNLTDRRTGYAMEFCDEAFALLAQPTVIIACPEEQVDAAKTETVSA